MAASRRVSRPFLYRTAGSRTAKPTQKNKTHTETADYTRDLYNEDNDWLLHANKRARLAGLLGDGFDYDTGHTINLKTMSTLFSITTRNAIVRSAIRVIQENAMHGKMEIIVRDKPVTNLGTFYTEYFEDSFVGIAREAIRMQHVLGLIIIVLRLDKAAGVMKGYIPEYGKYKVVVVQEEGVQRYRYYDRAHDSKKGVQWIENENVLIYDDFDVTARPAMDGTLNSAILSIGRVITDMDHLLESVALSDEMASRPATYVCVEPMPTRPIDSASSQMDVHFGDADPSTARNISMNIPLSAYPQSAHMERELAQTMFSAEGLTDEIQMTDAQNLKATSSLRYQAALAGAYQTSYIVPPHVDVKRLPIPPHPGTHFSRIDYYVGVIATALNIPREMLLTAAGHDGRSSTGTSLLSYELNITRFNVMIQTWNAYLMRILNTVHRTILYFNGAISALAETRTAKGTSRETMHYDMRSQWMQRLAAASGPTIQTVLRNPRSATDAEVLSYLYAAEDEGALRVHFSAAPSAVGINTLGDLYHAQILTHEGYVDLLSSKLGIDPKYFEPNPPVRPGEAGARKPAPDDGGDSKDTTSKESHKDTVAHTPGGESGTVTDKPRRSARIQMKRKAPE